MNEFNCLVLEDCLSDQLWIEMLLNQYPAIKPVYASTPQVFEYEVTHNHYNLIITDIKLQGTITGIDLIEPLDDTSLWVIICSAYDSEKYYSQYNSLPFTKFYLQKPLDEFIFKTHIETFLFAKN